MTDIPATGPLGGSQLELEALAGQIADKDISSTEAKPPSVASAPELVAESMTSGLPRVLELTGVIIAPTTLMTALMFYFGWLHAYWFCYYFGVNSTMLDLTTTDYLMRSVDGFFVPLTVVAVIALLVLWVNFLIPRLVAKSDSQIPRIIAVATLIGGLSLLSIGMANVLGFKVLNHAYVPPLSLAVGVLLLVYGSRLYRKSPPSGRDLATRTSTSASMAVAEWAGAFILVSISLFWAVGDYSAEVGTKRAQLTAAKLLAQPNVVVYSAHSLALQNSGVRELPCSSPDSTYHFRYDGLKLVMESGNQYFFLPERWTPTDGVAIIIPRSDSLRLEFTKATGARARTSIVCK
jgi:hypothetical protein